MGRAKIKEWEKESGDVDVPGKNCRKNFRLKLVWGDVFFFHTRCSSTFRAFVRAFDAWCIMYGFGWLLFYVIFFLFFFRFVLLYFLRSRIPGCFALLFSFFDGPGDKSGLFEGLLPTFSRTGCIKKFVWLVTTRVAKLKIIVFKSDFSLARAIAWEPKVLSPKLVVMLPLLIILTLQDYSNSKIKINIHF